MSSTATTVEEYLAGLPEDRRAALSAVREVILQNLPEGYEEGMQYGMIGYFVPHRLFPAGYHCNPKEPLPFAGLGSQKSHMALYLHFMYGDEEADTGFREAWAATGKKLDMGKCCLRFKKVDALSLDIIGEAIARMTVERYVTRYQGILDEMKARKKK